MNLTITTELPDKTKFQRIMMMPSQLYGDAFFAYFQIYPDPFTKPLERDLSKRKTVSLSREKFIKQIAEGLLD